MKHSPSPPPPLLFHSVYNELKHAFGPTGPLASECYLEMLVTPLPKVHSLCPLSDLSSLLARQANGGQPAAG